MRHNSEIEVLITGAGPVGMVTAFILGRDGINVRIIDKAAGDTTRTYACILHAKTMRLFNELGLGDDVERAGRRVDVIRCFNGRFEFADLDMLKAGGPLTILPQSELENILENRLARLGVRIEWGQQLRHAQLGDDHAVAVLDELSSSGSGYAVPHFDPVIKRTSEVRAKFIVGADGRDSHVRELLGIHQKVHSPCAFYHMYEIETRGILPDDIHIVVDRTTTTCFTPLSKTRARWIFQVAPEELPEDAHLKDRTRFRIIDPRSGELEFLRELIQLRAPWFDNDVNDIEWHGTVSFTPTVAERFGNDQAWLAGDAAHIAAPIGMQSMNVGICEGAALGQALRAVIRGSGSMESLVVYDTNSRLEWERLLNPSDLVNKQIAAGHNSVSAGRLLPCLPASGEDIETLFDQLGISFRMPSRPVTGPVEKAEMVNVM